MRFTSIIFHCAILISSVAAAEDEICIDPTLGYHWSVAGWGMNGGIANVGSDAPSFTTAGYVGPFFFLKPKYNSCAFMHFITQDTNTHFFRFFLLCTFLFYTTREGL